MSQENLEVVEQAVAAVNETYRTGDMRPWRRFVEAGCDPEIVLDAPTDAFTEGEWRGHDGAVGFVANQMEVLEGMWLRVDEYIDVDDGGVIVVAITFGGRARHSGIEVDCTRSMSFDGEMGGPCVGRSFGPASRRSKL